MTTVGHRPAGLPKRRAVSDARRHPRGGFTLVELMAVVAILGIMSSIAVIGILGVVRTGRSNGMGSGIQRVLANARARAVSERCPYLVQINGPTYNPGAAPVDVMRWPNAMLVYRKGDCTSVAPFYESGTGPNNRDKLVASYQLGEYNAWISVTPPGIVPADSLRRGTAGSASSLTIGYLADGQRVLGVDADGDGTSAVDGTVAQITVSARQESDQDVERTVDIPSAGAARLHQ